MTQTLLPFESRQPMAVRFLTQALQAGRFVNAYVLRGADLGTSYQMALTLAQILNCTQRPGPVAACGQCQPCRWIGDNAHPEVVTLTNLTYLPDVDKETGMGKAKKGAAQTQIVVDQLDMLLGQLGRHSGGTVRVVILAGAEVVPQEASLDRQIPLPPKDWAKPDSQSMLAVLPLDRKLFGETVSNKFLKTLEEPPPDVVFFLLTDSDEKLLETIVSRCQVVPIATPPSALGSELPLTVSDALMQWWQHTQSGADYAEQTQALLALAQESGMALPNLLTGLQASLFAAYRRQDMAQADFEKLKKAMAAMDRAARMLNAKVKPEAALETLVLTCQGVL